MTQHANVNDASKISTYYDKYLTKYITSRHKQTGNRRPATYLYL
ncbi:MAG: hypothetical protein WCH65_03100 [bacterium]